MFGRVAREDARTKAGIVAAALAVALVAGTSGAGLLIEPRAAQCNTCPPPGGDNGGGNGGRGDNGGANRGNDNGNGNGGRQGRPDLPSLSAQQIARETITWAEAFRAKYGQYVPPGFRWSWTAEPGPSSAARERGGCRGF